MEKTKMTKEKKKMIIFLVIAGALIVFSFIAPWITPHDPYRTNAVIAKQPPSAEYPFGTDSYGRCILSRVMSGGRTSIFASLILVLITSVFGTVIGILSGYYEGKFDAIAMRITDILLAFPNIILAIAIAGMLGGSLKNAIFALAITGWTSYARLARSNTLAIKNNTFVSAAKLSGISDFKIMFEHILPNIMGILIVTATLSISNMMMGIAGLSFLNLGVQVPKAEWGAMVSEGKNFLQTAPWIAIIPSIVLVVAMIIFNLAGDSVRDYLDPKSGED